MVIKKILKYAMIAIVCIATCGTVQASSTDASPTVTTETVGGAVDEMYNEFGTAGKVKAVDIVGVVIPSDIVFNIECDKDDGVINKIQFGVDETRNNSDRNMDLSVITVQDDSNGDGSTFPQTVNLYLVGDNKTLDEIKVLSEAKLESGTQNKKITTLQRLGNQQVRLYGEAASSTSHFRKERYTVRVTMKISRAPAS